MDNKVIFKAKRLDNNEWVKGFFTKKKINSLIVPVIEKYRESDSGDYMESIEIDGTTLQSIYELAKSNERYFIISSDFIIRDILCFKKHKTKLWGHKCETFPSVYELEKQLYENETFWYQPTFTFSKMRITNIKIYFINEVSKEDYNKFWEIK